MDMAHTDCDYKFRMIVIGDSGAGKSCLVKFFAEGTFLETLGSTLGVDFFNRIIHVQDGTRIKLQLWDTAGQERHRSTTKSYYRDSVGILLVYDTTNHESFGRISMWMEDVRSNITIPNPVFILVGCKSDLPGPKVSLKEANAFAQRNQMASVVTSSKTGENVALAFELITEEIYAKLKNGVFRNHVENWDGIKKTVGLSTPSWHLQQNQSQRREKKTSDCC